MTKEEKNKKLALLYWELGNEYRELSLLYDPEPKSDPAPAPDALVEAVKKVIEYSKERHTHDGGGYIQMLEDALAAHEKAGSDGT